VSQAAEPTLEHASRVATRLGIPTGAEQLLLLALTHPSRRHQSGAAEDNERLEFLGDALLGAIVSAALYAADSSASEGDLSERRASIVSRIGLAEVAQRLRLDEALLLGEGEAQRGGGQRPDRCHATTSLA